MLQFAHYPRSCLQEANEGLQKTGHIVHSTLDNNNNVGEVKGLTFKRNCVLRRWESGTLKQTINHKVSKVN